MTISANRPRRRWFSYSLRTGFVLMTIFGVWLGVQVKWIRDRHESLKWSQVQVETTSRSGVPVFAPWQIRLLGESGVAAVAVEAKKEEDFSRASDVKRLFPEATFQVWYKPPKDKVLDARLMRSLQEFTGSTEMIDFTIPTPPAPRVRAAQGR